jgi:type I restriction enzyme S subunit
MPSDRVVRCFADCAVLVRNTVSADACSGSKYIALEHIEEGALRLVGIGDGSDVTSAKSEFRAGDILFGKLRPYFRKVIRPRFDGVCSTDIWVVRATDGIDQGFLYYWMASEGFVEAATRGSKGTKMPRADWDFVGRLTAQVPPLPAQQRIASTLGSLDDKIELNRRMNRTLERLAQALFKSWFIDFDPVRAKAEGDPTAGGLPDHLAALFPERLVDSELGEIPEGWEVSTIGDEFRLTMGQSPPGETYNEERRGEPFFQGRRDFGFRYPANRVYCTAPTRFAAKDDTLMSVRAPVGDVNMAFDRCAVGRGVAAVRHKAGSRSYTYYAFQSLQRRFEVYNGEGTVFGSISQKDLKAMPWCAPREQIVAAFPELVNPIDQRIEIGETQTRRLAGLRDTLLPKFLSGELEVPEAEASVKEVAL